MYVEECIRVGCGLTRSGSLFFSDDLGRARLINIMAIAINAVTS